MTPKAKAVILARVSSKSQEDEGYSLDSQVKLLHLYCENKDLFVAKVFKITESASKSTQRRTFKEAMKFIEDNKIKHLIIEKVDRHVRNLNDAVATHDWLMADENKQVHFVKDSLIMHKNSRSQEWLNWGIRVVMSKNYIDNLREEAMKGWAEKLAQGWLPAPPPCGYMTITHSGKRIHVPDPITMPIMQHMFRLYLEPNHSIKSITLELERAGVRTRKGRPYSKSHVQKLLTNTFYIGINHFDGKDYPGAQETFITKELFDKVQQKMHRGRPMVYKIHNPALKNIITCEDCGGVITWQLQKGRYYGACQRNKASCHRRKFIREDLVEAAIIEQLDKLVCPSPAIIDWVANEMREKQHESIEAQERMLTSIQTQIDRLDRMDSQLYDDKLAGDIPKEKYDEKHQQFVSQKAELEAQKEKLGKNASQGLEQRLVLLELSQKAASIYQKKTPEQKRLIITKLFSKITSKDDSVSVSYTNFAQAIAGNVQKTKQLLGE
jgi:DNA invertase Pin-like site-specific DNA recombinase